MVSRYFAIGTPLIIDVSRMREGYAERLVHFAEDLVHTHHGVVDKMDVGLFLLEPRHVASPPRLIEYADPDARAGLADHTAGNADVRLFLTVTEVATIMRVSKMTVYRLVHSGELEAVRTGRSFRIPEQAVNSYLYLQSEAVRQR
jgi:excisionase family DNA binding protein